MFRDNQGSWMVMFLTTIFCVFIFSYIYNAFLLIGGTSTEPYTISGLMSVRNSVFMKAAAVGTWCGDFFTAWMVRVISLYSCIGTSINVLPNISASMAQSVCALSQCNDHDRVLFPSTLMLAMNF